MLTTLTALCSAPRQASGFSKLNKFDGVVRTGGPHNVGSREKFPTSSVRFCVHTQYLLQNAPEVLGAC